MTSSSNKGLRYASMATQMAVLLGIAVWAGLKIDGYFKWKIPVFLILLPLFALLLSLIKLIKELK